MLSRQGEVVALGSHDVGNVECQHKRPPLVGRCLVALRERSVIPVRIVERRIKNGRGILDELVRGFEFTVLAGEPSGLVGGGHCASPFLASARSETFAACNWVMMAS